MSERADSFHLFVYGTLQPGGRLYPAIKDYVWGAEPDAAYGLLYNISNSYPALVPGHGNDVPGWFLSLYGAAASITDELEQDCVLYSRIPTVLVSGRTAWVYYYLLPTDGWEKIERWDV